MHSHQNGGNEKYIVFTRDISSNSAIMQTSPRSHCKRTRRKPYIIILCYRTRYYKTLPATALLLLTVTKRYATAIHLQIFVTRLITHRDDKTSRDGKQTVL